EDEARAPARAPELPALAERLRAAAAWARTYPATADLATGYFAAGPKGAAAALVAAAAGPGPRAVMVCGEPAAAPGDLSAAAMAPVLLVVGGGEIGAVERGRALLGRLGGIGRLVAIPAAMDPCETGRGRAHLARLATLWFGRHLGAAKVHRPGVVHPRRPVPHVHGHRDGHRHPALPAGSHGRRHGVARPADRVAQEEARQLRRPLRADAPVAERADPLPKQRPRRGVVDVHVEAVREDDLQSAERVRGAGILAQLERERAVADLRPVHRRGVEHRPPAVEQHQDPLP